MTNLIRDVTDRVDFELNDNESLPLVRCVCGQKFEAWDFILGMEEDYPRTCDSCHRKLFWTLNIKVWEVVEEIYPPKLL